MKLCCTVLTAVAAVSLYATVELPTIEFPKIEAPSVEIVSPSKAPKEITSWKLPKAPSVELAQSLRASAPEYPTGITFGVPSPDLRRFFVRDLNVRDIRNVSYTAGAVDWAAWSGVLAAYADKQYARVAFSRKARVIAEVRPPRSFYQQETLRANLDFYKARGYDAVLLVVTERDTADSVRDACVFIRHCGMNIWLVFGGVERLQASAYPDPHRLKSALAAAAPYAECFVLGWRRTSAHLLLQDSAYMKYLIGAVRETNPDLPVLGELFYGEYFNKNRNDVSRGLVANIDDCCAGALVNGLGTAGTDFANAPGLLRAKLPDGAKTLVMVVVGDHPYYLTQGRRLSREEALISKRRIEEKFLDNGGNATVTMSDDGSDGRYHTDANNNLSETLYSQL